MTPWWITTLAWIGAVAVYFVVAVTFNHLFWSRRKAVAMRHKVRGLHDKPYESISEAVDAGETTITVDPAFVHPKEQEREREMWLRLYQQRAISKSTLFEKIAPLPALRPEEQADEDQTNR